MSAYALSPLLPPTTSDPSKKPLVTINQQCDGNTNDDDVLKIKRQGGQGSLVMGNKTCDIDDQNMQSMTKSKKLNLESNKYDIVVKSVFIDPVSFLTSSASERIDGE